MAKPCFDAETTPLLKKNFTCEGLNLRDEENEESTVRYQIGGVLANENNKIIGYNMAKLNGFRALWYIKDSVFCSAGLWWNVLGYLVICGCCAGLVFLNRRFGYTFGKLCDPKNIETLDHISGYFSFVVAILLGMYVSNGAARWWAMRDECLGGLWTATNDIILLLATRCRTKEDRVMKEKILRLCLLSHRLLYAKARQKESPSDLQGIVDSGLMTPDEAARLQDETAKAQLVWVWISTIFVEMKKSGKIDHWFLGKLETLCAKATNSILTAFSYLHTQIPFNYVHLLVTNVILSNFLLVSKCGFVIGGAEIQHPTNHFLLVAQLLESIIVPFMYHAILGLVGELENPFGTDEVDFPCLSYHVVIRNECETYIRMGESIPDSLLDFMEAGKVPVAKAKEPEDD
mmetsp:Transcript_92726/g.177995  ORF Transcript_92726/g.177995 Transcript_92726/m.177995 type:complete len:403 (+) Transcript_92726:105-1313(+)